MRKLFFVLLLIGWLISYVQPSLAQDSIPPELVGVWWSTSGLDEDTTTTTPSTISMTLVIYPTGEFSFIANINRQQASCFSNAFTIMEGEMTASGNELLLDLSSYDVVDDGCDPTNNKVTEKKFSSETINWEITSEQETGIGMVQVLYVGEGRLIQVNTDIPHFVEGIPSEAIGTWFSATSIGGMSITINEDGTFSEYAQINLTVGCNTTIITQKEGLAAFERGILALEITGGTYNSTSSCSGPQYNYERPVELEIEYNAWRIEHSQQGDDYFVLNDAQYSK